MKEYEKLAEDFCIKDNKGDKDGQAISVYYYSAGFLKAREMACRHGFYETVKEMHDAIAELGEKEV